MAEQPKELDQEPVNEMPHAVLASNAFVELEVAELDELIGQLQRVSSELEEQATRSSSSSSSISSINNFRSAMQGLVYPVLGLPPGPGKSRSWNTPLPPTRSSSSSGSST